MAGKPYLPYLLPLRHLPAVTMVVNLGKLGYISSGKKKPFEISSTMTVWAPRQKLRKQRAGKVHVIV